MPRGCRLRTPRVDLPGTVAAGAGGESDCLVTARSAIDGGTCDSRYSGSQSRSSSGAVARYSICSNVTGTVYSPTGVVLMMTCWVEGRVIEK